MRRMSLVQFSSISAFGGSAYKGPEQCLEYYFIPKTLLWLLRILTIRRCDPKILNIWISPKASLTLNYVRWM